MCATLHVLWSLVYIGCGAIQLVVGIFFLAANPKFETPFLRLGSNVVTGGWNVVVGVSGALVACVGPMSSPGRHEALLYLAISVLAFNAVNLAVLELVEWKMLFTPEHVEYAERQKITELLMYAHLSTSAAAAIAMVVAFLDSQLTFCSLQHAVKRRLQRRRSVNKAHSHHGHHGHHHHDHSADSEYIILPRVRPSTKGGYEQYTRSWVFDVDGNGPNGAGGGGGGSGGAGNSSARYQQLDSHSHADKCRDAAAAAVAAAEGRSASSRSSSQRGDTYTIADVKALRTAIANGCPPPDSSPGQGGPSGSKQYNRQQKHKELMREREHQKQLREQQQFQQRQQRGDGGGRQRPSSTGSAASSTGAGGASPATRHHAPQQQQHAAHAAKAQPVPVIEESPPSGRSPDSPAVDSEESRSPDSGEQAEQEGAGYHSLMSELTQVIRKKPSPKDDTSSADFNRELEAALQDIHDLDSSTGGTLVASSAASSSAAPPPPAPDWGDSDDESSASSRTVGKRRSHPRLGRAFAIPVPPPVPPPHAGGTLRGTLRSTQTGTLTSTLRRQWDREWQQQQQQDHREEQQEQQRVLTRTPSPELPPPPPPPPVPHSPVRSKTVVTICDGDMVVREMNNNDVMLVPVVMPPELHELDAPVLVLGAGGAGGAGPGRDTPSPPPSPTPSPSRSLSPEAPLPPPPVTVDPAVEDDVDERVGQGCSMGSVGRLGGLSLLRKGKTRRRASNGCAVRLSQELQGAVLQSESLVFLSDSELVARHERNRRVQREIEQRVQQQISGHSGGDSLC
ncbi:protein PRRC2A-like isoform X2 [Thrips palmi]|nr:protein PRRC2A-like isoform X2 [Thrips palmi]